MSILNTIKEWFFGKETKDDAEAAPYKMEPPTLNVQGETPSWPFPSGMGAMPVEGAGVVEVKSEAPAKKPKAVKAVAAKPKAEAKPKAKPAAKPKAEAKPKAVKAVAAKPKASKKA